MSQARSCSQCGTSLSNDAAEGFCPGCMLEGALKLGKAALDAGNSILDSGYSMTDGRGTSRLGDYELLEEIARGGMGVVYRARQTSLNRLVALKIMASGKGAWPADETRLRRFEQETGTLAALNHPNILVIHDTGSCDGVPYLVSELLDGQTLRQVLQEGPVPVRRSVDYGMQIAQGLAAAHSKAVVHRDLKPENLFLTRDGRIKILDFGLAKLRSPAREAIAKPGGGWSHPEKGAAETTMAGLVFGTPGYMAPEQVRGETADHRSDIFAFGVIFYELLSGRRAFQHATTVGTMNAILTEEPPELSDGNLPPGLERVVRRCLEKEPERRFQSASDLAFAIETAGVATSAVGSLRGEDSPGFLKRVIPWAVAAIAIAAGIYGIISARRIVHSSSPPSHQASSPVRKFELYIPPPANKAAPAHLTALAISPDGRKIVYKNAEGLWLRSLERTTPAILLTSADAVEPFWSPNSLDIGYLEGKKLHRIAVAPGSQPRFICFLPEAAIGGGGGAWLSDDRIIFATGVSGLYGVSAKGGEAIPAILPQEGEQDFHNPSVLPEGRGVLFVIHRHGAIDTIAVLLPDGSRKTLLQSPKAHIGKAVYSPSGHVLYGRLDDNRDLWSFEFSLSALEKTGEPFRVSDEGTLASVADDGTLVFNLRESSTYTPRQLVWVDRAGRITGRIGPLQHQGLISPRLSPDQRRIAAISGESFAGREVWLFDLEQDNSVALTRNEQAELQPYWLEERKLLFSRSTKKGWRVVTRSLDSTGSEQELMEGFGAHLSTGGEYLLLGRETSRDKRGYVSLKDPHRRPIPFPEEFQKIRHPKLSPDGTLLAFESDETGQHEVYLVAFPGLTNKMMVSRGGGEETQWNRDGSELFYLRGDAQVLMSVPVRQSGGLQVGQPAKVCELPESIYRAREAPLNVYDVTADGSRFLMVQEVQEESGPMSMPKPTVLVVENWFEEFRPSQ